MSVMSLLCSEHNPSGQSLLAARAQSHRHTVYNPLYSRARSRSGSLAFMNSNRTETSMGYHANTGIQGRKTRAPILSLALAHSDKSQTRAAMKTNLCFWAIFAENLNKSRKKSGKGCRGEESISKKRLFNPKICRNDCRHYTVTIKDRLQLINQSNQLNFTCIAQNRTKFASNGFIGAERHPLPLDPSTGWGKTPKNSNRGKTSPINIPSL